MTGKALLVAGIGNIFLGDDGFGVEVVRRLAGRRLPEGVRVVDYGTRGFDLACALTGEYAGAILVDATARGGPAGTLYVIEPDVPASDEPPQPHALHPARVLQLACSLGEVCPWLRLVGCEPLTFGTEEEPAMGLSEPVKGAVDGAVELIEGLIRQFLDNHP